MARTKLYCSTGTYRGFSLNLPDEHQRRTRQPAPLSPNSSGFWWPGRDGCGVSGYGFGALGLWGFGALGLWVSGLGEPQGIAMNRSLVVAMGLALAAGALLSHAALAQSPFPPAPQQSSPFPPPPQQSQLPADST